MLSYIRYLNLSCSNDTFIQSVNCTMTNGVTEGTEFSYLNCRPYNVLLALRLHGYKIPIHNHINRSIRFKMFHVNTLADPIHLDLIKFHDQTERGSLHSIDNQLDAANEHLNRVDLVDRVDYSFCAPLLLLHLCSGSSVHVNETI